MKNLNIKKLFCIIILLIMLFYTLPIYQVNADLLNSLDKIVKITGTEETALELTTFIYDKDGNEICKLYGLENRIPVEYKDLPNSVIDAVISIEDERFLTHKGIDIKRTLGAIFTYLKNGGNSSFGGSTITQQLIKNVTKDNETSIQRKIREWVRAYKLEKELSKEEIFEAYINTIYMGEGSYGIEIASQNYFAKSVKDLNLAEAACLAATIQSPEITNPYKGEEAKQKLLDRQKIVLNKMLELGKITQEEYDTAINTKLVFQKSSEGTKVQSYFIDALIEDLAKTLQDEKGLTYEEAIKQVYTGGYKIYSTFDPTVQNAIDTTYADYSSNIFYTEYDGTIMQSSMVVLDQSTGDVLGLIGGIGEKSANLVLNRATQSYRQPGSCMKPFGAYGPAFEKGAITSPEASLDDSPLPLGKYNPANWYGYFNGFVTVRQAIAQSMNLPAVKANQRVDTDFAYTFAKNCGLKSLVDSDKYTAPLALGGLTNGVTPLELASAYATIANSGMYNKPRFYTKILDASDNLLIDNKVNSQRAMKDTTAYMLTECLQEVITNGTATGYVKVGNMPLAGKTGNSNYDYDQWFCGYTPYYTIACWNGYDTNKSINRPYPYASMALFNSVMNKIHSNKEIKYFDKPEGIIETKICKTSGLLATDACRNDSRGNQEITAICASDSVPTEYCNLHETVKICGVSGLKASSGCYYTKNVSYIKRDYIPPTLPNDWYSTTEPSGYCTIHDYKNFFNNYFNNNHNDDNNDDEKNNKNNNYYYYYQY
ncbi:MAG: transglycosylase domain-containing protein [Clostridia bacterium]|nr:transglycosylase domain-containing protein [Clostridia bacterium]